MAKVQMKMPEDFLRAVSKLESRTDEVLPRVLETGSQVVEEKVRSNMSAVIGTGTKVSSRSTGELERALGVSKPLQDRNGDWNIKVGFSEPRSDGKSNAMIANIIEYGRHGQPAKPFLKPAKSQSRKACIEVMKTKLQQEVDSI
jgi:HK97 gp10 family phage protein